MRKRMIIAIDGPAASGKSTTAKGIAGKLSYTYIDTGAMYRAAGLAALKENEPLDDKCRLRILLDKIKIKFVKDKEGQLILLNGEDVSARIRDTDITKLSSEIAVIPDVRKKLVQMQQDMGKAGKVIMDGRDIGTVVFPNADFKFFLVASLETRAQRRWKELADKGIKVSLEEVAKELKWRDENDSTRKLSPLLKADDAIEVDTTNMTIEEQINHIYDIIVKNS